MDQPERLDSPPPFDDPTQTTLRIPSPDLDPQNYDLPDDNAHINAERLEELRHGIQLQQLNELHAAVNAEPVANQQPDNSSQDHSRIELVWITQQFIKEIKNATLDNIKIAKETLHRLRNPECGPIDVSDPDTRLSLDLFMSCENSSQQMYSNIRNSFIRRFPELSNTLLSYDAVKKLVEKVTGVISVSDDMCINSCHAFMGPFAELDACYYCLQPRYDPTILETTGKKVPRKQACTFPLGPQVQAPRRSSEGSIAMSYRRKRTQEVLEIQTAIEDGEDAEFVYEDFLSGSDYLDLVERLDLSGDDAVVIYLFDGAQLYRNKGSDTWIAVWIICEYSPTTRYKKKHVLPSIVIPGPNKPKNSDSFTFQSFHHISACQGLLYSIPMPLCHSVDLMHLAINIGELQVPLWRGTFKCEQSDDKLTWDWVTLTGDVWQAHGKLVAESTIYFPSSFHRPPRNPAEKINSGYKATEYFHYLFGLGPAFFRVHLPKKYWQHYCKLVRGIRTLTQRHITGPQVREAQSYLVQFVQEYENLYYQRRMDRLHFCRPWLHTILHIGPEVIRIGPGAYISQYTMERAIGDLGQQIRQPSNPYANLCQNALLLCQANALKSMFPELDNNANIPLPKYSHDNNDGYIFLTPREKRPTKLHGLERRAIEAKLQISTIRRWGRLRLPNGQVARSLFCEGRKVAENTRVTRNLKVSILYFQSIKLTMFKAFD